MMEHLIIIIMILVCTYLPFHAPRNHKEHAAHRRYMPPSLVLVPFAANAV
jgi:hypothetical protein